MHNGEEEIIEEIKVLVADETHEKYVDTILQTIADAAKDRGTGIAKRTHEYVANKMREAKAVIALVGKQEICNYFRTYCPSRFPSSRHRQADKGHDFHSGPYALAPC